jgi:hypothetical protein
MNIIRLIPIAAITVVAGCSHPGIKGDGVIKTENRSISGFSKIVVAGDYQIEWFSGKPALNISADQNLLPLIKTVVSGDTLQIDSKADLAPAKSIVIILSGASLAVVQLGGDIRFKAHQISGDDLKLESAGKSNISVDGSVAKLEANLTGASRLNAKSLRTQTATLSLLGASDADITVTGVLKVSITGAGSLTYSGNPTSVKKNITGVGSIRPRS